MVGDGDTPQNGSARSEKPWATFGDAGRFTSFKLKRRRLTRLWPLAVTQNRPKLVTSKPAIEKQAETSTPTGGI